MVINKLELSVFWRTYSDEVVDRCKLGTEGAYASVEYYAYMPV